MMQSELEKMFEKIDLTLLNRSVKFACYALQNLHCCT